MEFPKEVVEIELDRATAFFLMRLAAHLGVPPKELKQTAFEAGLNRELSLCKQPKKS
jgi:hypothetical protein